MGNLVYATCLFIKSGPVNTLNPAFPSPMLQPMGSFTIWLPSSPCPVRTFHGSPVLLLGRLWPHAMGCLRHRTPFHSKTLHSSHLRSLHHLCICSLPLGLVCSAPSSLLGYFLPQITCEFHRENFLEDSDSFRNFYYLHAFSTPLICRTHAYFK